MQITIREYNESEDYREIYRGDEVDTRFYDSRIEMKEDEVVIDLKQFTETTKIVIKINRH